MPELPEVETTRAGIEPHVQGKRVKCAVVRQARLRWPVPNDLSALLNGQQIESVKRRAKYLLFSMQTGTLLIHLGMSGSLRIISKAQAVAAHDHVDIELIDGMLLRYTDPRRFGAILWLQGDPLLHPLLKQLGPEPLSDDFSGQYLRSRATGRRMPIKSFIMNSQVVAGVGNIYANEALFRAGIDPRRAAGRIALPRYQRLAETIKLTLNEAIVSGGTTLRDFVGGDGKPGYFKQELRVYGRAGEACLCCNKPLTEVRLGQRSTVFCSVCQR